MSDLTVHQAAEKAYQAEIILALMQIRQVEKMESSEVAALVNLLKDLVGDTGGFLGEEVSREEEENA
ncbi:hypothetical protein J8995_29660 [Klebsiella quasipneumoniae subsp. quasipneumoniae]|uniref:Uncharacterized protein n=1 Tax=Klebsiella quasivariicola TaxID=2026240 RepID=A0ABY6WYU6_9ENTR|nr:MULTISPECIES: hypothetical protein [Klebsiella/Raoultella group]EMD1841783.1 hypothetical protein [Raoultella planticola]HCB1844518.1 hypothetical protein [Klebsiella oxytoca]HCI6315999.1 hypothetical protein [Klebsiella quasipneumoniae subsp. similipneumoniae]MCR3880465.1 hypothetical protein [Klebsiella quasipneumoniae]MDV0601301.1 hypothetical protein [Raoultella ornithinolytica]